MATGRAMMQRILGPAPVRTRPGEPTPTLIERLRNATWTSEDIALAVRWSATCLATFGAWYKSPHLTHHATGLVAVIVVMAYAGFRTFVPIRSDSGPRMAVLAAVSEVGLYCTAAALTGGWSSPFALCAAVGLVLAGLLGGWRPLFLSLAVVCLFTLAGALVGRLGTDVAGSAVRVLEVGLTGVVGAYCRRLFADQIRNAGELDFLRFANEVHTLLLDLHARTVLEPRTLTLKGTVSMVVERLKEQTSADLVVLLLRDRSSEVEELDPMWQVAAAEGLRLPPTLAENRLPPASRRAQRLRSPLLCAALAPGDGLDGRSESGIYAPLWARHELVGLLIAERRGRTPFGEADVEIVERISRHAGVAVENTRWFARLRRRGAEMERDRIARELHDRVGQSLAAVAIGLDRISADLPDHSAGVGAELDQLSMEIRAVIRQVREKLSDMRTEPGPACELDQLLGDFLDRVAARSGMEVSFQRATGPRPPVAEEIEVWRIAQEAVINAERHSDARHIAVSWGFDGGCRVLEVRDDGKGIDGTAPLRRDAYGLLGMRERAEIIGAGLRIDSTPGRGTCVRLRLRRSAGDKDPAGRRP